MTDGPKTGDEVHFADIAPAIEFACWTVVVIAPFLRLINGPAVTNDQWWTQAILFTGAAICAFSLRIYHLLLQQ